MIKNKDFIILFLGRLITNFGDSIYLIATMLLVFSLSGSTFYTGLALFLTSSTAIVQIILSPILNRINMKKFLIVTQIIQGVLLLFIPYLHITGNLKVYHVLIIMPIISFLNQLVYPGQLALLPKIVDSKDLVKANSLFGIAYQGSDAIFNFLGGIIITTFGFIWAYYIDSITFFINAILFLFLSKVVSTPCSNEKSKKDRAKKQKQEDMTAIFIAWGRKDGCTKKKIADMLSRLLSIPPHFIGDIEVQNKFSLASLPHKAALMATRLSKRNKDVPHIHLDERKEEKRFSGKKRAEHKRKDFKKKNW